MVKLDHLSLPVTDWQRSREWYVNAFGLAIEFEVPTGGRFGLGVAALQDDAGLTIFLEQTGEPVQSGQASYAIQVDDVAATFSRLTALGARVTAAPGSLFWGYGAEILDPDGHVLRIWDEASMAAHS